MHSIKLFVGDDVGVAKKVVSMVKTPQGHH